jgi:succinate-semialdehyde dehydrogenase / glutarate-semialdehyde dehydrogenase
MLRSVNPYTQTVIQEFAFDDASQIARKIENASNAFRIWKRESFPKRSKLMFNAAHVLRESREHFARIITDEMGKVLSESRAEIDKCATACEYFAAHAEAMLKDESIPTEASSSFIAYQPLGPVLAIMPWNFPFWQVFRFAAPALMAGNVGLLKHAANVTGCSLAIESVFNEAGFPEHTFQSLLIDSKKAELVIGDDRVAAVTLTGSEYAGSQVASLAGKHLKKTVLELGGSDPFIVLEDADLEEAAKVATQSRMQNAGQSCIAAKRFIIVESIKDEFMKRFKTSIESLKQGNPLSPDTTTGPLARLDLAEDLEKQLNDSVTKGAEILTGGKRDGCNFQPTLLENVQKGMPAFDEEMFGPVAAIITVKDESEAIRIANDHRYGLGGSVWTSDIKRGERVAREIESGCVFVNSLMRSDPRLPFGGTKKSGYGRELSELGIKEFMNAKTIFIK